MLSCIYAGCINVKPFFFNVSEPMLHEEMIFLPPCNSDWTGSKRLLTSDDPNEKSRVV